jgi:aryl-alcohol dehydrogenase-like predicted oxidoreductase
LDQEPSAHTLKTPFFPLALYDRDRERARQIAGEGKLLKELALRFVLDDPRVHSAIVGFGTPEHAEELARLVDRIG